MLVIRSDVTPTYEMERRRLAELEAAKLEADRANEAKSAFLSGVSHDIRSPLNGIIGFTDLALGEEDESRRREYLEKVRSSGDLLLDLVNDTLELSRIESGKMTLDPEIVNIRELAMSVVTALRPSAEMKSLDFEAPPEAFPDTTAWADRLKLQKVFLNLLSNAIKYTRDGGHVQASIEVIEPPGDGCNYRITVEDTGIGIAPEFIDEIFEPFSQEQRKESASVMGTGLGLSIVRRIVDLMEGTITVRSEVGVGSRFTVDLPLKRVGDVQAEIVEARRQTISLSGKTVLLCEDNYLNAEIAEFMLKEKGMRVDCASNGKEGLEMFADSEPGTYDAILMDVRMPIMDGREATRAIRKLDRPDAESIPIIALSADAFEEDIRDNLEAGMNLHVTKPIRSDQLFEALGGLLC